MKRKRLIILFICLLVLTGTLVVLGLMFNKTESEKINGLTNQYDVSASGQIAFVNYENGKPQLFLYNEKRSTRELVAEFDENTYIFDPTFSPDDSMLAYVTSNKDKETKLKSTVHLFDTEQKESKDLFTDTATITELEFLPNQSALLYLRSGTFENYSPIAGKRPHGFDVYAYQFSDKAQRQLTHFDQYSMMSLRVDTDGKRIFIQKDDDANVTNADESFEVKQRIFEIPLEQPDKIKIASDSARDVDIYSFILLPSGKEMIFQSVSNPDSSGTFEYELYRYNMETKEEKQLTHFGKHASDPIVSMDGEIIYFMLDTNFGKGNAEYHLYKMNSDGSGAEEITFSK
ncbi:TolB-like translocation protein [Bacillus andreraoultii]|uniref:PD40 domain-containing protein n=1 Tax=Bacillus andreraoultii TaxID=1499685 RepID=UPI00053B0601|nr:PD40 domain-containing protein [Bacillus andreraoultii]